MSESNDKRQCSDTIIMTKLQPVSHLNLTYVTEAYERFAKTKTCVHD